MKKCLHIKCVILLLVFMLSLSILPVGAMGHQEELAGHWAASTITKWLDSGMTTGYPDGTFKPNEPITRAKFMMLINKAWDFGNKSEISFADVSEQDWFYNTVAIAVSEGYIGGYPDGSMKPNALITRQEVATIVNKLDKQEVLLVSNKTFKDSNQIASWAELAVANAVSKGLMGGHTDGSFKPQQPITRAEAITVLDKLLTRNEVLVEGIPKVIDKEGIYGTSENVAINYDVTITIPDVTIQNVTFTGTVIIHESVGDGEVYFENVNIADTIYVRGGGMDSVYFNGGQINNMTIDRVGMNVNIVSSGNISSAFIVAPNSNIIISAPVENCYFGADDTTLSLGNSNVDTFWSLDGINSTLNIGESSTIGNLILQGHQLISIHNEGGIGTFSMPPAPPSPTGLSGISPFTFSYFTDMLSGNPPLSTIMGHRLPPPPTPPPAYFPSSTTPPIIRNQAPPPPPRDRDRDRDSYTPPPPTVIKYYLHVESINIHHGGFFGGATGGGSYEPGESVLLIAIPPEGELFSGWESDIGSFSQNPLRITMPSRNVGFTAIFRDDIRRLQGTAQLIGYPYYDETLTVSYNITWPVYVDEDTLYYSWYRDGALIPNYNYPYYYLTLNDVRKSIHARVSGGGALAYGHIDTPAVTAGKMPSFFMPPSSLSNFNLSVTATSVHLESTVSELEFKLMQDSTLVRDWQPTGEFTELDTNTNYQMYGRFKETTINEASAETPPLSVTTAPVVVTVSASSEEGVNFSITGFEVEPGKYLEGDQITFEVIPTYGDRQFVGWFNGDNQVSTNSTYTFTLTEDIHLVAVFEPIPTQ